MKPLFWPRRLCLLLLACLPAHAGQPVDNDPVVIAFIASSTDGAGGKAVLSEAYRRLGVEVEFRPMGGAEALAASSSGAVDAELQRIDGINLRYPELVQVPIPINYVQGAAFATEFNFPATGWRSLQPYRIGIVEGIIFSRQGTEGMDVTVAEDYDQLFEMLLSNRVDVAVMPRINGQYELRKRSEQGKGQGSGKPILEMEGVLETLFLYHYLHKSRSDLTPALTEILTDMLRDGTTKRLRDEAYRELLPE
jgi:polar amino acid transport system substrate-binding protein